MFVVVSPIVQSIPWHAGKAGALLYRVTKSIHEVVFLEVVFLYCCYCIGGVVALFGHRPCLPWLLIGMMELQVLRWLSLPTGSNGLPLTPVAVIS